jgi:hypothetical protein
MKKSRTLTPSQKREAVIENLQRENRSLERQLREAIAARDLNYERKARR